MEPKSIIGLLHTLRQLLCPMLVLVMAKSWGHDTSIHLGIVNPQSIAKTSIKIEYPNSKTVWITTDTVSLRWDTRNIPANKTIKFYLSKDDMVVQELGIFKNTQYAEGILLHPGLQTGDNYRVIGIELFPDDKYSIAKYATPFFTIKKAPRNVPPVAVPSEERPEIRNMFDGRKLNYVKELTVSGKEIGLNLWDHGRKDGDVVSIYLNGEAIVYKYSLEYTKRKVIVTLDPSRPNDLFLYAHNLGRYPPNTVSIELLDGTDSESIILNSDLKSCEAVLINVEE